MPSRAHEVLSKSVLRVDSATPLSDTLIEIRRKRASHVAAMAFLAIFAIVLVIAGLLFVASEL